MSTKIYPSDLVIVLAGSETFTVRSRTGRNLLIVTMAADEASCTVQTIPITQWAAGTDLGDTGYNYESEPPTGVLGLDRDIRDSARKHIRGQS